VVADRFGSLWDRAWDGTLTRYAPDGRLLAQHPLPNGGNDRDQLALAGDTLVLQVNNALFTLPVTAPAGTAPAPLKRESDLISFNAVNGRIASKLKGEVFLVDPATGDAKKAADVKDAHALELGPDGAVYASADGKVRKYAGGAEAAEGGWPKGAPGERAQLLDGFWYGHAWHGTIRRFTAALDPSPGVVLGGASGSFIGHLDQNAELSNGRGMAKVGGALYAVSGLEGTLHLLSWDEAKRQMTIVRRIGAVPVCTGLGLDRNGVVWFRCGTWAWDAGPDAPMRSGVNAPEHPGTGQCVMLENDRMVAPGYLWGKPAFYNGPLSTEVRIDRIEKGCALKLGTTGSAVYARAGKPVLLVIEKSGAGQSFFIDGEGRYQGEAGPVALKASGPAGEWTSLAMKDGSTLLAAADGAVVEMAPEGNDWKETRRWSSWGAGPAEKFGARIWIAADAGMLWVADAERHRVLCFDLKTGKPVASFGTADKTGDDLASLNRPQVIAARGRRAVAHDAGNQRLVKLGVR
jgi:sugar lactone lactonase YvrE